MTKNILALLLLCFVQSFSQTDIDKEAKRLENLCRKNSRTPDSLFFYGNQLLTFGKEHKHLKATIEGYFALGFSSSLQSKENLAVSYFDSAIAYKEQASKRYFSTLMRIMRNKAIVYARRSEFEKAEQAYNEIIAACKAENKMADAAYNYNGLGIIAKEQGKFDLALKHYKKAMKIWDSIGKEGPKTTLFLNMGVVQARQGNYEQSTQSYRQGLQIAKTYKNERDIYKFYNNLSVNYRDLKQFDSASHYLHKLIPYYKRKKQVYAENLGYMNIGNVFLQERKLDSAYWYLQKSLKGLKPTQQVKTIGENYRLLGYVLFQKQDYSTAKRYLDSSYNINKKHNIQTNLAKDYNLYARIYEQTNDHKKAVEYFRLEKKINDSIFSAKTAKDYNELLVKQKVKKHKNTIDNLSSANSLYKSNLAIVLVLLLGVGVFSFLSYKKYAKGKKEIKNLQEELDAYHKEAAKQDSESNFIHLKSKALINTNEILYIKSDGHYMEIFLENKKKPEIERSTLTELLQLLPNVDFVRIHKSYIVNIRKIKIINATQLMLENGEWIKLSRTYKQQLKEMLHKE